MAQQKNKSNSKDPNICLCNKVKQSRIEQAIEKGCHTLPRIFDATSAGVGACGGSCQPYLERMLNHYLKTGKFLEEVRPKRKKRR